MWLSPGNENSIRLSILLIVEGEELALQPPSICQQSLLVLKYVGWIVLFRLRISVSLNFSTQVGEVLMSFSQRTEDGEAEAHSEDYLQEGIRGDRNWV